MKKKFKLLCFGFGQVAKYFVNSLIKKKFNFELITTNTSKSELKIFNNIKHKSYYFSDEKFDEYLLSELKSTNKILISIPPINQEDLVLKMFKNHFKKNKLDWVTYLSATSVYGDKKGGWVDENTLPTPALQRGINRLNAENNWIKCYQDFKLPIQIFRLSGIYSNEKNIIKRLQQGNIDIVQKKNHFFSRIHVEDIAEILTISLTKFKSGQIYNISDDYPCPNNEVIKYAAHLMKINLPKETEPGEIKNEMLKEFYKDSKRVKNNKMKLFFSYKLRYPTFKEGLNNIRNYFI